MTELRLPRTIGMGAAQSRVLHTLGSGMVTMCFRATQRERSVTDKGAYYRNLGFVLLSYVLLEKPLSRFAAPGSGKLLGPPGKLELLGRERRVLELLGPGREEGRAKRDTANYWDRGFKGLSFRGEGLVSGLWT
jgi:hypothetical protein